MFGLRKVNRNTLRLKPLFKIGKKMAQFIQFPVKSKVS